MTMENDRLSEFRSAYLDYLEGERDEWPALEHLSTRDRMIADALIRSTEAAAGIDPYASRPSIEQLLAGIGRARLAEADSTALGSDVATQVSESAGERRLTEAFPVAEMLERGWIGGDGLPQMDAAVCELLETSSWDAPPEFAAAARRSHEAAGMTPAELAWLGHIRQIAGIEPSVGYDQRKLAAVAKQLPGVLQAGAGALPRALESLATCGVRVLFCEGLSGVRLIGAVMFLPDGGPVIGLTTRGDRFDSVVYTLLHECAHLTLGHISPEAGPLLDDEPRVSASDDPREAEANAQAAAWMFPDGFNLAEARYDIGAAARKHSVHPSCVAGRIEYDLGDWSLLSEYHAPVRDELRSLGLLCD